MGSLAGIAGMVLLILAGTGAIVMAGSRQVSRRLGGYLALGALAATVLIGVAGGAVVAPAALVLATTGFWLVDRGIPGNRPRPLWVRIFALLLAAVALAAIMLLAA